MATQGERGRLSRGSRVPQAPEAGTSDGRGPIILKIVDDIVLKINSCFARIRCRRFVHHRGHVADGGAYARRATHLLG